MPATRRRQSPIPTVGPWFWTPPWSRSRDSVTGRPRWRRWRGRRTSPGPGSTSSSPRRRALFRAAVTQALERDITAVEHVLADTGRPLPERLVEAFDQWAGRYIGPLTRDVAVVIEDNPGPPRRDRRDHAATFRGTDHRRDRRRVRTRGGPPCRTDDDQRIDRPQASGRITGVLPRTPGGRYRPPGALRSCVRFNWTYEMGCVCRGTGARARCAAARTWGSDRAEVWRVRSEPGQVSVPVPGLSSSASSRSGGC